MKIKKIKLTETQIKEIAMLEEHMAIAHTAFDKAARMLKDAEGGLWHYLIQEYPEIEPSRKHRTARYNRIDKIIEYGLPDE